MESRDRPTTTTTTTRQTPRQTPNRDHRQSTNKSIINIIIIINWSVTSSSERLTVITKQLTSSVSGRQIPIKLVYRHQTIGHIVTSSSVSSSRHPRHYRTDHHHPPSSSSTSSSRHRHVIIDVHQRHLRHRHRHAVRRRSTVSKLSWRRQAGRQIDRRSTVEVDKSSRRQWMTSDRPRQTLLDEFTGATH